jgi:uncharacterized membrane protein HdeD (DUF308 family)
MCAFWDGVIGVNQESSEPSSNKFESEPCIVVMAVFTIMVGILSTMGPDPPRVISLVIALGLSTIAFAILHLARVLQLQNE